MSDQIAVNLLDQITNLILDKNINQVERESLLVAKKLFSIFGK